jgi:glycosyltransferase involved in cell wall biosynthesis
LKLRVVFVDHVARLSGGEIALLRLLPALAAHVDARVVLGEDGPLVDRLRDLGVETEVLPLPTRVRDARKERMRARALDPTIVALVPPYVFRLSRRLRALRPDLVHTNSLKAALYGGIAARLVGLPVVWHIRDRISPDYLPAGAVSLIRAAARVLPAAVVANSQTTLATLPAQRYGGVLYNPVVPDSVEQPLGAARRATSPTTIGIVGRLAPWKGQHVFLEAFAEAFRGSDVRGRVIGSALFGEDAYAASLERRVQELGIQEQVEFRGFREDVWAELRELDVLVHCSVSPEPFGQVVLEGMAAGLAVVAAGGGGPAELIRSGVDGLLTRPGDAGELAGALRRLHDDRELRTRLGAAARERSRTFTPERAAQQLLAVYRAVLGR